MSTIFNILIIAVFTLGIYGCGYKAPPYYLQEQEIGDEHVTFKVKNINIKNDESKACEEKKQ